VSLLRLVCLAAALVASSGDALAFKDADLDQLRRTGVCYGCDLKGAKLRGADLYKTNLNAGDLRKIDLRGALMANSTFLKANLRGADLSRSRLRWTNFGGADMRGAKLIEADLLAALMPFVDLRGAVLIGADLGSARLHGANLAGAILRGAKLYNAKLRTVIGLTQEQLDQACGNHSTELPPGLTIAPCPATAFKLPYEHTR
jgi:uncharacterized protein YjbI with pentapeptide repeats